MVETALRSLFLQVVFTRFNRMSAQPRQLPGRSALRWVVLCLVCVAASIALWQWCALGDVKSVVERAVAERKALIDRRSERERREQEKRERAERLATRELHDAAAREERIQWAAVIETATLALEAEPQLDLAQRSPRSDLQFIDHRPGSEESQENVSSYKETQPAEFQPFERLRRIEPPQPANNTWARNPVDRFVLAKLEAEGLAPNPPAAPAVLARRVWFDLIGLPPDLSELQAYIAESRSLTTDSKPSRERAYDQLVTRLMDDPAFGERWARVWLDLARYADSNGYEEDELRPYAYPYRDFVIWAMNVDLPFDRFIRWQIAGDELAAENPLAVAATGFFTAAPLNTFIPQESERFDELDDMVSTMSSAMLGLTVGCARCHDHMYDPISTAEYYGLVAIFAETSRKRSFLTPDGGREYRKWLDPVETRRKEIRQMRIARIKEDNISELDHFTEEEKNLLRQPIDPTNERQERLISLCERCLFIMDEQVHDDIEPLPKDRARFDQLRAELDVLEAQLPPTPSMGLTLSGSNVSKTHILGGGDVKRRGDQVGPGFLSAVTAGEPDWEEDTWRRWLNQSRSHRMAEETEKSDQAFGSHLGRLPWELETTVAIRFASVTRDEKPAVQRPGLSSGPRSALAHWMTDVESGAGPLLARVIVNRLWQHHFGQGLVRSSSDFGSQGEQPSHPELLEWLAGELVDNHWSLKHIHRLIVTSATYQQSTVSTLEKRNRDPDNRLLSRRTPRRISAEMMRDAMLQVAGDLNRDRYGPGVQPVIPREAVYNTQREAEETWPCDFEADRPALWRRSIYVMLKRTVPVPMLRLFDAPDGSFSCHERKTTTVPTQTLALWNARFVTEQSRRLARRIESEASERQQQIERLYLLTLSRLPTEEERTATLTFLSTETNPRRQAQKLAELCQVLLMSNEFFYLN